MIKVENKPDLVRDPHSFAIINIDKGAYEAAKKRKSINTRIESLEEKFDILNRKFDLIFDKLLGAEK